MTLLTPLISMLNANIRNNNISRDLARWTINGNHVVICCQTLRGRKNSHQKCLRLFSLLADSEEDTKMLIIWRISFTCRKKIPSTDSCGVSTIANAMSHRMCHERIQCMKETSHRESEKKKPNVCTQFAECWKSSQHITRRKVIVWLRIEY